MKRKLFFTILLAFCACFLHAGGAEEMHGLELKHVKVPFYKERKIQLLVFADSAKRQDQLMVAGNTFLDMLLEDANVDKIPDGWSIRPVIGGKAIPQGFKELYPLGASFDQILGFWSNRYNISEAVIFTTKSFISQEDEMVYGEDPVFFRSPLFDLDGLGFSVRFKDQIININEDVHIILRSSDMDPRKIAAGAPKPAQQRIVIASAREMQIYQKENKIVLNGNVEVIDGRNRIRCQRLRLFLNSSGKKAAAKKSAPQSSKAQDEKAVLDGISRVLADGDVLLYQFPEDPFTKCPAPKSSKDYGIVTGAFACFATDFQKSTAEHLEYDVKREIIILTGTTRHPTLQRGTEVTLSGRRIELLRHEDKIFVLNDCRIIASAWDKENRRPFKRYITSDRANFNGQTNIANFHGNVLANDQDNTLRTDSLRLHLVQKNENSGMEIELLFASGNVRIDSKSEKELPDSPGRKVITTSRISSNRAELDYRKIKVPGSNSQAEYKQNKLVFYGNVKVRDDSATLDCDRLDLFLADKKTPDGKKQHSGNNSGAPLAAGMEGQNKTLTKMIAKGDVKMTSDGDILETDMLTLHFRDLPPGVKPTPGMIQSGGVQLVKIYCDGAVHALSFEVDKEGNRYARKLTAANAVSDLLKDYSEFHGNVALLDGATEIYCQDMYVFTGASPIQKTVTENAEQPAPAKAPTDDLDADPFALEVSENAAPRKVIAISDNRNLKRVVCRKQVVLKRTGKKGQLHKAGGDEAVYSVNTGEVVLTALAPNRPWLQGDGRKHFCDVILSDITTGDLRGVGNVVVLPDK